MLVNLSESLGYKTPSRASTGLFVASFLGLGSIWAVTDRKGIVTRIDPETNQPTRKPRSQRGK